MGAVQTALEGQTLAYLKILTDLHFFSPSEHGTVLLNAVSLCVYIVAYLRHARTVTSKHAPTITQQ
jgi:hypothetical protein